MQAIDVVILAAGKGTRMGGTCPKVLHKIAHRSLLSHVYATTLELREQFPNGRTVIVYGENKRDDFQADLFAEFPDHPAPEYALQAERLGTGHAVQCGLKTLAGNTPVLVLYADQPLMPKDGLASMIKQAFTGTLCLATFRPHNPTGYGRIVQDNLGGIEEIVEEKDASDEVKTIGLCNAGVMAIPPKALSLLAGLQNNNRSGEYYLTDLVGFAVAQKQPITHEEFSENALCAVNTLAQLAEAEAVWQQNARRKFLEAGVSMQAPETVYFSVDTRIAAGSTIEPHVYFGRNVDVVGASQIRAYSHLEGVTIGKDCTVGPFSRIRGNSQLEDDVRVGNFVEIKNTHMERHVRASHHSYLGDAKLEECVNIGAGTITCNYDGIVKSKTLIKRNAFVGSNCSLVAPLVVAEQSILGAGSVITENNQAGDLTMERNRQMNIRGAAKRYHQRSEK